MVNRKLLYGILAIVIVVIAVWSLLNYTNYVITSEHQEVKDSGVFLWENGKEKFVAGENSDLSNFLLQTLHKLNLQAKCAFGEETIQEIKKNDKIIELRFRFPMNLTISQWIEPEERNHIQTDEKGYRILENVKTALFILEDNQNRGLEGHVLVGHEVEGRIGYSCWAISKNGEIDKTWIDEVERSIGELELSYKVEECSVNFKPEKVIEYDENTKTLIAYVRVNCCGVNVTVEKENNTYKIVERQYGELCNCTCIRKITVYNVSIGTRVEFIDKDDTITTLTPRVNVAGFCGWSTYGECKTDGDCITDGCSAQICRSKFEEPIGTTCEWFDCYNSSKYGVACKCVDGECQWVK